MRQLGKSHLKEITRLMMILDDFEEEQVEAKTQVEVMEEMIILQEEEEDMAEIIQMVTIILVITQEGIIILSTQMKSVF